MTNPPGAMPPLPDLRQFHNSVDGVIELVMKRYGQACAEAAAAPLIARVAELQADATYPDDVEIAVPAIGSRWGHSNGDTYTVTGYADMFSDNHQRRPPRIVYRSAKTGRVWSREHSDWYRAMKPLDAALAARKEQQP